ncbi:hypothetical protein KIH41_03990 [Litoribacter ruber]|uniref:DUF5694 domain-containing protein n=1 Tax=Litoribacter ruber TaxID=702568 RepID=UPI001BDA9D8F|nr:DUF5694 domain-containing protein [Litoribacter ruber]MBT0810435.1 hypothetical protein [Litoribacter ruber]
MKNILFTIALYAFSLSLHGQEQEKTRILLMGTTHFTPSTSDSYSNEELKLDDKMIREIEDVILKLASLNPDQIFIEVPRENQENIDKQFQQYMAGTYQLQLNEIDLIGFQTAKRAGLEKLTCVNYKGKFDTKPVFEAAINNGEQHILDSMDVFAQAYVQEMNGNPNLELRENLVHINSSEMLNKNQRLYTKYFTLIGSQADYEGAGLVAEWYKTNIHIYTNIISSIRPTDKYVIVIYGVGHIPILKHLFESNPDYKVTEVGDVFGSTINPTNNIE